MGNPELFGHPPRIVDILTRTAGSCAMHGLAMIIELQCEADDIITGLGQQGGNDRGIHPARHRHNDAVVLRPPRQIHAERELGNHSGIKRQRHRVSSPCARIAGHG